MKAPFLPRRTRVPVRQQMTVLDCGLVALQMVLAYYGRHVETAELRTLAGSGRAGTNAKDLLLVARAHGLTAWHATRLETAGLASAPAPAILHWDFNHFVVLEEWREDSIVIVDPAHGRKVITLPDVDRHFTGVALFFRPSASFETNDRGTNPLWRHVGALVHERSTLAGLLVVSLILQTCVILTARGTQILVDDVIAHRDQRLLLAVLVALLAIAVLQSSIVLTRAFFLLALRARVEAALTSRFFRHLLALPFQFFETRPAGDLLMRLASNTTIRDVLSERLLAVTLDCITVSTVAVALLYVSRPLAFLVIGIAAVRVALIWRTRARQRELVQIGVAAQAKEQSYAVELLRGIASLKAAGDEARAYHRWERLFRRQIGISVSAARVQALADSAMTFITYVQPAVLLVLMTSAVIDGSLSVGSMFSFLALVAAFNAPVVSLAMSWTSWELAKQHIERINEVLDAPPECPNDLPPAPELRGTMAVRNVTFRYAPNDRDVLTGVTFDVPAGSFVGVVGPTGSGKSTLAKLLLGLYEPNLGSITFDGVDPRGFDRASFRQQIGTVLQQPGMLSGSIREYIAAGIDCSFDEVVEAAKLAAIHDDVTAMPMRYDTYLAEEAANLSGGQRQRLAIARAVLRRPRILIFDEATNALDAMTERIICDNLAAMACTRVVIAHRLSSIEMADLILVLQDGRIVERGSHEELLGLAGTYARLYRTGHSNGRPVSAGYGH